MSFWKTESEELLNMLNSGDILTKKHRSLQKIEKLLENEEDIKRDILRLEEPLEKLIKILQDLRFKLQPSQGLSESEKVNVTKRIEELIEEIHKKERTLHKHAKNA